MVPKVILSLLFISACCAVPALAQSVDQNFPTPVSSNQINGTIRPRDIGDPRATRHYYVFEGGQGDVFVNVVTKNFAGDIDIFTVEGQRPLTKIVLFAEATPTETGRLLYLRKTERLLMRIEGRAAAEAAATYKITFGGAFTALAEKPPEAAPSIKDSDATAAAGIRVNSVGTITAVVPKPKPSATPQVASTPTEKAPRAADKAQATDAVRNEKVKPVTSERTEAEKPKVVVTPPPVATIFGRTESEKAKPAETNVKPKPTAAKAKPSSTARTASGNTERKTQPKAPTEPKPDPLASIHLVVELKNGETIERPMSEVARFSVDKGILVVVGKDGRQTRYSIFDVAKVTIQ